MGLSSAATRLERSASAALAAVDDRPLAALAHPDGHGFHDPAAVGRAVAGVNIDMQAREAIGAMVPVVRAGVFRDDGRPQTLQTKVSLQAWVL